MTTDESWEITIYLILSIKHFKFLLIQIAC